MPIKVVRHKNLAPRKRSRAFALRSAWSRWKTKLRVPKLNASRSLAAVLAAAMAAVLGWFWLDLSFYVYDVDVTMAPGTGQDQLVHAAGLDGLNIFFVSERQIRAKVQDAAPAAVTVDVSCSLPNRVRLVVSEKTGQVVWDTATASYLVDADGQVLRLEGTSSCRCPRIVALDSEPVMVGGYVDASAVSAAIELQRLLPGIARLEYSKTTGLVVADARGWRVYLGNGERLPEKVASMRVMVDKIVTTGAAASVIDVRFQGSAYYR